MIAILGILAGVVVFSVAGIDDKGQGSACDIDKRTIATAEEAFFAKNGNYATEADLEPDYLSTESKLYDVQTTGTPPTDYTIVLQAGSPCTS